MHVKKLMKLIRKDEGSGLILALMTLMVLSILGAALGVITIGSYKLGDVNRDDNSAYYIAEAGANMAYEELQTKVNDTYSKPYTTDGFFKINDTFIKDNFIPKVYNEFSAQFGKDPEATVTIGITENELSRDYNIISVGTIGQRTRTVEKNVKVTWISKSNVGSSIPDITTTVAKDKIFIKNGVTITGTLHLDSADPGALSIMKDVDTSSEDSNVEISEVLNVYVHPEAKIEEVLSTDSNQNLNINIINREAELDWEVYKKLIEDFPIFPAESDPLPENWTTDSPPEYWTIETEGKDKTYVIENLTKGIKINGGGRVDLFVKNSINIGNSVEINKGNKSDQLQVFYKQTEPATKVTFGNGALFNGTLFSDLADFEFGNNATLTGLFITGGLNVSLGGGTINTLLIAPNATVTYDNKSDKNAIKGIVVGKIINMVNNLTLEYDNYYLENFPLTLPDPGSDGSGDGSGGSGGGDLIITEPGIEN